MVSFIAVRATLKAFRGEAQFVCLFVLPVLKENSKNKQEKELS